MTGTVGYWLLGGRQDSLLDDLYMTAITITTVGYGEIVDLSDNPPGRLFTMLIAVSGIGVLFYVVTNLTASAVEGELTKSFRRKRMEKAARNSSGHYIVCGIGSVGYHIVNELSDTKRPYVLVDLSMDSIERALETFHDATFVEGDATENNILLTAGIQQAKGLFAVTSDDNQNLVISLTAKDLNPNIRVVARCNAPEHSHKMRRAGADTVVSPGFIGGLRMASEMVRPTAVSFLDTMLRDKEKNLRVEEIAVPDPFVGRTVSDLNLKRYPHFLLLAVRTAEDWVYNPSDDYIIKQKTH